MGNLYLHINKEYLNKTKKEANKKSKEDDEESKDYLWEDLNFKLECIELNNGKLSVSGETDLGFIGLDFHLDMDIAIEVIKFYMKKLEKLKSVLESTK